MLSEGIGYVHGNLGKDWERKEVNVKGSTKVVWESALAYQPKKDDETVWVNLTVWPSQDGSDGEGDAIASGSGKGTSALVYGALKRSEYTSREGEARSSWQMNVYKFGTQLRPARNNGQSVASAFPGAKVEYADKAMEPF
jgi:single-stranded DNA-binding protein